MPETLIAQLGPLAYVLQFMLAVSLAILAQQRGRRPMLWFFLGIFFGVWCVPFLILKPDLEKQRLERRVAWMESQFQNEEPIAAQQPQSEPQTVSQSPPQSPSTPIAKAAKTPAPYGWYFVLPGQEPEGPIALSDIIYRARQVSNKLAMVWHPDLDKWTPIREASLPGIS